ncbi:hypothetical protein CTAYLR_005943 [Chrysophaeum taylorii]|uniref:Nudix hydrolase domain-containing protein n=1 Tax=Chrysophaeum taylorii TaxID=2483200 RepID=A0AAD7XK92_9STRA|nr:hypothetical protein CTAYLR_005943 [Chrysophaeum taylorii]
MRWTICSVLLQAAAAINFCSECGSSRIEFRVPPGDERERFVCADCGTVTYVNPKIVCGCVLRACDNFLLARRNIDPRRGFWGFPQGYMELGETTRECAARETLEETGVKIDPRRLELLAVYNLPNQVQLLYDLNLDSIVHADATTESSEIKLFHFDDIPFGDLAFPTVRWAINFARDKSSPPRIQQRTKVYDKAAETWVVADDTAFPY